MMAGGKVENSQPRKNIDVIQLTIEAKYNLHTLRTRRSCSFEQKFIFPAGYRTVSMRLQAIRCGKTEERCANNHERRDVIGIVTLRAPYRVNAASAWNHHRAAPG